MLPAMYRVLSALGSVRRTKEQRKKFSLMEISFFTQIHSKMHLPVALVCRPEDAQGECVEVGFVENQIRDKNSCGCVWKVLLRDSLIHFGSFVNLIKIVQFLHFCKTESFYCLALVLKL